MTIKLTELRSFVAVADHGSFSAAARELKRAQSVVSTHIAGMEAELGFKLFDREPVPVLTAQGKALLPTARRVIEESVRFESKASALFKLPAPILYMGVDMALEIPLVLDLIRDFGRAFPAVKLQIENISSSETDWFFRKSEMSMALVFSSRTDTMHEERVIGHVPLVIAVSKKHALTQEETLSVDKLRALRQLLIVARDSESQAPLIVSDDNWEVDNGQWAVGLAARGIGWTIVPRSLAMSEASLRNQLKLFEPPFAIAPERLVLRIKTGEVPDAYTQWWEKSLIKVSGKLGLASESHAK